MTFEAIILDSEGVQIVGPTVFPGSPGHDLRLAVSPRAPRLMDLTGIDHAVPLAIQTVWARCERRRGDGVFVFRRVEDFRAPLPVKKEEG